MGFGEVRLSSRRLPTGGWKRQTCDRSCDREVRGAAVPVANAMLRGSFKLVALTARVLPAVSSSGALEGNKRSQVSCRPQYESQREI